MTITSTQDLYNVALALNEAVLAGLMARDYAKLIWKEVLKKVGLEVAKPVLKEVKE
jgi:hypothetical protein